MYRWSTQRIFSFGIVGIFLIGIVNLICQHFDVLIHIETLASTSYSQLASKGNGIHATDMKLTLPKEMTTRGPKSRGPVSKPAETKVYRWKEGKWKLVRNFCSQGRNFNSAKLRTPVGSMKMYIHEISKDIHVSGSIKRSGLWEHGLVKTMLSHLNTDSRMGVIDLGSQLGTYSLVAALAGHPVVAVDPLVENVLRFCRSVQEANLTDRITILFTALSDKYTTVTFKREARNIGGTHIQSAGSAKFNASDDYNPNFISTVRLDDILPFVNFSKAFMKIDVESHEYSVLKEGRELLDSIDIRGIMMEWFQLKKTASGDKLKELLTNRTYHAVEPLRGKVLDHTRSRTWPNDILWLKH